MAETVADILVGTHLDLATMRHVAETKVREAVLAVTGA
jgi:hypothetical protein